MYDKIKRQKTSSLIDARTNARASAFQLKVSSHQASASTQCQRRDDACDITLIEVNRNKYLLQNGVATYFGAIFNEGYLTSLIAASTVFAPIWKVYSKWNRRFWHWLERSHYFCYITFALNSLLVSNLNSDLNQSQKLEESWRSIQTWSIQTGVHSTNISILSMPTVAVIPCSAPGCGMVPGIVVAKVCNTIPFGIPNTSTLYHRIRFM